MKGLLSLVALATAQLATASLQIVPGATWTASNTGQHIQAHGGGIIKVGSTYYWVGENKEDGSSFKSVRCYSSTDLIQWQQVGDLLTLQSSGDLGPSRVVERPKIIYNASTGQYVMYMHIDNSSYAEAKVGVATSSSVCGTYTYKGSFQPLGQQSRDMGLYQESDGTAYLLTEDRANGLRIDKLSADYLSVASNVHTWAEKYEAPALVKANGVYFMFASQLTGWDTNDNKYSTATSLSGPWSAWQNFADSGSHTYNSQTTFVLPVGNSFMFMGDRWVSSNLMRSTYIWLPITLSGTTATMKNAVNWIVNASNGTMTAGPSENSYEGESSSLTNGAKSVACGGCSGATSAGYIGSSANGIATFNGVSSTITGKTTIRIKHENGDTSQRFASVSVNGVSQTIAFLPSDDGNTPASSVIHANLNAGSGNTVVISKASSGGWVADIDRLMVPVS